MLIQRFPFNPIVAARLFEETGLPAEGHNINGPSLVRVPAWVERPLGRYYLYFGNHNGLNIRLAYADELAGPWRLYQPDQGVLQLNPKGEILLGDGRVRIFQHIASPDVHLDEQNRLFTLYFHGPVRVDGARIAEQRTFVTHSCDGLDFNSSVESAMLGRGYFRVWNWRGRRYAMANRGTLYREPLDKSRAPTLGENAWEENPHNPLEQRLQARDGDAVQARHVALDLRGDSLTVFFSALGHAPERILATQIELSDDWRDWQAGAIEEVLRPQTDYEGIAYPLVASKTGPQIETQALRDPCFFRDSDGREFLLYSVAGEMGLAIAEIKERGNSANSRAKTNGGDASHPTSYTQNETFRQRTGARLIFPMKFTAASIALVCCGLRCAQIASANDAVSNATLELYPTYHAVGVEVVYTGDDDNDVNAEMEYRLAGENVWREGVDMTFDREKKRIWASVFRFEPGQKLDVRVRITDPDAPQARTLSGTTMLRVPRFESGGGATYHVSPLGQDQNSGSQTRPFATFARAVKALKAGDTLVVGRGTYRETLDLSGVRGTAARPIIVRGAVRDVRAVDAPTSGQVARAGRVYSSVMPHITGARAIPANSGAWTRVEGDLWSANAPDAYSGPRNEGYLSRNDLHLFRYPSVELLRAHPMEGVPENQSAVDLKVTRALKGNALESLPAWSYDAQSKKIYLYLEPGADPNRDRFDYATLATGVALKDTRHVVVRDLELSHFGEEAVDFAGDTDNCALVNNLIHHNRIGVLMHSLQSENNAIWNNQVYDRGTYLYTWRTWMSKLRPRDSSNGILFATGRGTSIVGNLVRGVFNSIAPGGQDWNELSANRDLDIIDNVVANNGDDGYEIDGGGVNMRMLDNYSSNALEGLSAAPIDRGPVYIVGNRGIARLYGFKMMNNVPSLGATYMYHNTYYSVGGRGIRMPGLAPDKTAMLPFANKVWKNNIIQTHGTSVINSRDGAELDNNCYWVVAPGEAAPATITDLFIVTKTPTSEQVDYDSLAAYRAATGQEKRGLFADPLLRGDAITEADLRRALVEETIIPFDARLQAGSPAIDRGAPIRGINAGFADRAPDIGAFEAGRSWRYGGAPVAR